MCDSGGRSGGARLRPLPRPGHRPSATDETSELLPSPGRAPRKEGDVAQRCLLCVSYLCQPKKEAMNIIPHDSRGNRTSEKAGGWGGGGGGVGGGGVRPGRELPENIPSHERWD